MFKPSTVDPIHHNGFKRTYRKGKLSLGLFFPLEAFAGDTPSMENQTHLARLSEELGFAALWFRDVPLRDPTFGDVGQVFDPWTYLGFIAGQTEHIALGTASIVLPLRNPLHTAKAAASIDQLSKGRLLLGVASGDRPVEFPAFNIDPEVRDSVFRESLHIFREAQRTSFQPLRWSQGSLSGADVIPKPTVREVPFFVTGSSRQSLDWIARESMGWINYPRAPDMQKLIIEDWRREVENQCGEVYKPFTQSLYIDLVSQPDTPPARIHLGYRLGRNHLARLLRSLEEIGVDHVILNLKYGGRPASEVIAELGEHVVPEFSAHGLA